MQVSPDTGLVMTPTENRAAVVRLGAHKVDGILTDGLIYFSSSGDEPKAFRIKDRLGIKLIQKAAVGYRG